MGLAARRLAALCALFAALAAPIAGAQSDDDLEQARETFTAALSQEAAGDWAGALEKMESVGRVKLTAQVRYHIARCKEHLGRHTEALGEYRLAEFEAQKVSAPELEEITRARQDLEARVPKLLVKLPVSAAGAKVTLDGVLLGPSQFGSEIPVNPGRHRLVAKLGDRQWHKRFKAREGHSSHITLTPPPVQSAQEAPPETPPSGQEASGSGSALPWIAAGVGAAGFLGAAVFYGLYNGAENDLNTTCRGSVCPESARDLKDKSDRYRVLSGVALGVGVVGAGTALVLFLTESPPSKEKSSAPLRLRAEVDPSSRALNLSGSF